MYNQRESLACIAITPALQEVGLALDATPKHPQVADSIEGAFGLISCPDGAGDQFECHFPGNPVSKMPSGGFHGQA